MRGLSQQFEAETMGKVCYVARWEVITAHIAVVTHTDIFHRVNYNGRGAHRQRSALGVRAMHIASKQDCSTTTSN